MADQGFVHHLRGLARRRRIGHDQPVFLPGQTLREPPDVLAELTPLDNAPRILLAFAQGHQPREQPLESLVHRGIVTVPGQSRKHRLGALCQCALHAADLVVVLARDPLALLPPPHLAQRELQQRQPAGPALHRVEQRLHQAGLERHPGVLRRADDRLLQLFAVHRSEIFHVIL